jgi:predicted RNA-binding protein with PUA-like domain
MNWLVKEEPSNYSFVSLQRDGRTLWSGVRNPLAQKHLKSMTTGDRVFFYHTGNEKSVVGIARVAAPPAPDPGDATGKLWAVTIVPDAPLPAPVTLAAIKADPFFADFALVRMGRLSVMPVTDAQWARIVGMAGGPRT